MRQRLVLAMLGAVALLAASLGTALAAKPTVVRAGNLVLKVNGGVAPKKLPKRKLAPITLNVSGNVSTTDGSHPPAAKTITIDFDKQGAINARGLAVCRSGQLQARDTRAAKRACNKAIVGKGSTKVQVAFPDQAPFTSSGPLVLFNGGVRRGTTTMLIHAYVNVPAPTALVTVVKVKKVRKGRYGTRAIARIPTIAGGSGSVLNFQMSIRRKFKRGGKTQSYLLAKCAKRKLFAHGTFAFSGGPRIGGTVVRPCRVR